MAKHDVALIPGDAPEKTIIYNRKALPQELQAACVRTETGHTAEIAIPATYLDEKQGTKWQAFRLNIAVDDYDGDVGDHNHAKYVSWQPDWRRDKNVPGSGTFERRP